MFCTVPIAIKGARTGNQFQRGAVGQLLSKPKCHNCYECSEKRFVSESKFFQHEHLPPFQVWPQAEQQAQNYCRATGFPTPRWHSCFPVSLSVLISPHLLMQQPKIVII